MVYMIINMIRHKPKLYLHALYLLQDRCSQRQTPHNLSFRVEDVSYAIEMLSNMEPRQPLTLAEDLCEYSRALLYTNVKDSTNESQMDSSNFGGELQTGEDGDETNQSALQQVDPITKAKDQKNQEKKRKAALKQQ